jgi:hypothetical protein
LKRREGVEERRRERRERKMKIWEEERIICRGREKKRCARLFLILRILVF